jgi:type I restriction enzyme M protein
LTLISHRSARSYQRHFSKLKEHQIPLPPLAIQKRIVAEIEGYQIEIGRLNDEVAAKKDNIQKAIAQIWGENPPDDPEV